MNHSLAIIENVHRGSIEEQFSSILWLCRIMRRMGMPINVLLMGNGVVAVNDNQKKIENKISNIDYKIVPTYKEDILNLQSQGVCIYAHGQDLKRLNIHNVIENVQALSVDEISDLIDKHDRVWFW